MDEETKKELQEAYANLPQVVQKAIAESDLSSKMQLLANEQRLHVDQWQKLEDEVMLTLLGLQDPAALTSEIETNVGVSAEIAAKLAEAINQRIFEPIRQELDRQLGNPEAKAETVTDIDKVRNEALAGEKAPTPPVQPTVTPGTPPAPPPTDKAARAPASTSYTAQAASTDRKTIEGDPYRELPQ